MSENKKEKEIELSVGKVVVFGIIIVLALIFAFSSFYTVHAGERAIVLTFGDPDQVPQAEGLHFKMPFVQSVIKMNVQTQKYEAKASAASQDLQTVSTDVAVNYHIDAQSAAVIYQRIGINYQDKIIQPTLQEVVKAATAQYTAEQLITRRAEVKDKIEATLREKLIANHINVESILITNFDFSESFNNAIEAKVTNEQNALAAKNKLEQVKYEADQRVAQATAEAEAIKIQAQAITVQGGKEYVQLQAISRWNGVSPVVVGGNNMMPFLNLDISTNQSK